MRNLTFTAKEVVLYFDLPYGKNTFYKKLRELGFLDKTNYPSEQMLTRGLMIVRQPMAVGFKIVNVPIFTWEFLLFIEKYLVEIEAD
jgi:hypothetical protein